MPGRIEGRVAVITGGASGMGRETALRFLDEGASVVIADLNQAAGDEAVKLAADAGYGEDRLAFLRTNVADEADSAAMIELALSRFGRLDCMFCNAGIGGAIGSITQIKVADWDETFAILVRSVFLGIKHAARAMQVQKTGGSIISTASIAGLEGGAGPQAYSAAKAAVVSLTKNAAVELAPHRIRVNAIAPGYIQTPLGTLEAGVEERTTSIQPWPEFGSARDIAGLALFLSSDESSFISGETILCDGALLASGPRLFRPDKMYGVEESKQTWTGMTYGTTGDKPRGGKSN